MNSDVVIRVENLSKCYHIYDQPRHRLLQMLFRGRKQYYREFWALKDVSFEVKKAETVGIIGRNGSGKSTLLQMICGTLNQTSGIIQTNGRIAALLELGSGFNPEFTGRENVFMNAAVFGLSQNETEARFDEIISFADIGDFIEQPVKTYSSGMLVRLAFAVIANVDADILIIDEALAVGDALFQQKCMRFLRTFQGKQGSVLFVSHDTGSVLSLCDRAVFLEPNGSGVYIGDAEYICKIYHEHLYSSSVKQIKLVDSFIPGGKEKKGKINKTPKALSCSGFIYTGSMAVETVYIISTFRPDAETFGDGGAKIINAGFIDKDGGFISSVKADQKVQFFIQAIAHKRIRWPAFGFMIKNGLGEFVYAEGTDMHFRDHMLELGEGDIANAIFTFTMPHLIRGRYFINVAFAEGQGDDHIQQCWMHDAIQLDSIGGRLVHGYSGMNNMTMSIQINSELNPI